MGFLDVVKEIVAAADTGITPQGIREVIKSYYPEFYATERHKMHVERGNYADLDHALLAQVYGATRLNRAFTLDKTKKPVVIRMAAPDSDASLGKSLLVKFQPSPTKFLPMTKLNIAAARVRQGDLLLYTTSMKVRDLMSESFYSVETLDPEDTESKGYQRLLNRARAKKLADYILKGQDSNDVFLPTSIFLATHNDIKFDEKNNTLEIDSAAIGPFSVVDGQHRLEGLRLAMEKDERVLDFEVPVNIAVSLPKLAQMCHFLIVNTTQKSVDKSVEQRILARLSAAFEVEEDLPSLPKWILNTVQKGEVDKAVKYVDYLNDTAESPWFKKIHMANADGDKSSMNQHSFVKAIVKYVLTANNPLSVLNDFDKEKRIFLNYWTAIASNLDDGNSSTLYKYNGVELFCKFSIPFFTKLQDTGKYTVAAMDALLERCLENVEGEYAGVGHPDWWKKGGQGSGLNAGAINQVFHAMTKALHATSMNSTIEI